MPRPTTRVLALLELLQAHPRLGGAELARRLEVDRRTVRRYVALLEELGIPLTAERGRDGAYMLVSGFKLPPMMFTDQEATALALGLLAARGLGLAEAAPAVESAQAKLERVLPEGVKRRVRALRESVRLDLSRPVPPRDDRALAALAAAAQGRTRVHLRYVSRQGVASERDFDAYGLAYSAGCWYAVGTCHLRGGVRTFRLDRVASVEPREARFERPVAFDVLDYLKSSLATLPRAHAVEVLLLTDLETARRQVYTAFGLLEWSERGVLLRSQADDLAWFAQELSRLPFSFEILRPAGLRRALAANGRRLLRLAAARNLSTGVA
jgi:predicted DNA-binding transcriptional regulator YafY